MSALISGNIEKGMSFYTKDALVASGSKDAVYVGLKRIRDLQIAVPANVQIDAEIGQKDHFRMGK